MRKADASNVFGWALPGEEFDVQDSNADSADGFERLSGNEDMSVSEKIGQMLGFADDNRANVDSSKAGSMSLNDHDNADTNGDLFTEDLSTEEGADAWEPTAVYVGAAAGGVGALAAGAYMMLRRRRNQASHSASFAEDDFGTESLDVDSSNESNDDMQSSLALEMF